jgi:hypothetical protein
MSPASPAKKLHTPDKSKSVPAKAVNPTTAARSVCVLLSAIPS